MYIYKDYEHYKNSQILTYTRKFDNQWVSKKQIKFLSYELKKENDCIKFGICHGVRSGKECLWFSTYLNCKVIGTEIGTPKTGGGAKGVLYKWDFHDYKESWVGKADFIYSNSFDHSFNPSLCLKNWVKCLNGKGVLVIHCGKLGKETESDPFKLTKKGYTDFIEAEGYKINKVINNFRTAFIFVSL
jgi:hypothetical protein